MAGGSPRNSGAVRAGPGATAAAVGETSRISGPRSGYSAKMTWPYCWFAIQRGPCAVQLPPSRGPLTFFLFGTQWRPVGSRQTALLSAILPPAPASFPSFDRSRCFVVSVSPACGVSLFCPRLHLYPRRRAHMRCEGQSSGGHSHIVRPPTLAAIHHLENLDSPLRIVRLTLASRLVHTSTRPAPRRTGRCFPTPCAA